jgi:hypothetical protein
MHSSSSRWTPRLRALSFLLCLTILLALSVTPILAQSSSGTLSGQVTDQQGALVPAAEVRITDKATSSSRSTLSNDAGRYTFADVQPGTYDVTVKKDGFTTAKFSGQVVDVGQVLTLDVPLAVGATATTVEVQAAAGAELQTLNATVGSTMRNESLNLMPNLARDASYLAVLQVGVTPDVGTVAGANYDQNKYMLDGGNNSDDMAGGNTTYTPGNGYGGTGSTGGTPSGVMPTPVESIEEFKVGTLGQGADFGAAAGSQVQMVTKRGTNTFHGAAYEYYFSTDVGAANGWKPNHTPDAQTGTLDTPLPSAHRNRYGGALGGELFPKAFLGGKWYFFANYEAQKFPNNSTFERGSPTATYRAGVIMLPTATGNQGFNINNSPVTVGGVTYPGCGATQSCDPRGLGVNPLIQKIWATMPLPNDGSFTTGTPGDGYGNSGGYLAPLSIPQTSQFIVGRIDHDFNEKNKFFVSYRYYDFDQLVNVQTDMGGLLPGATQGQYTAYGNRPQKPGYWVSGLTTTINPNMTNDLRFSYLRNYWNWQDQAGPPQFSGLGAVVEVGGESSNALIPYNVDSQDTRQRYWRGHDYYLNDSLSHLHGNHLFQYGFTYQRNHDIHGRNDNGVGIDTSPAYIAGSTTLGSGISSSAYTLPPGVSSSALNNYEVLFDQATGTLVSTQVMYTRSGANLALNPLGTPGFDDSIIPSYEAFATDTWHIKPHVTLTYGLTYELSMPPYELNGKQVQMVDAAGDPINVKSYLTQKMDAALAGSVYQPQIGFDLIGNAAGGENKYPYNPFYGGFSPHVSLAWNPNFSDGVMSKIFGRNNTVIRGGYGRIYGRLNGVDLMLVPLLGPGLLQAVSCVAPTIQGSCAGPGGATLLTAFRIGVDGMTAPLPSVTPTLPQPFVPGSVQNGLLNAPAADGSQLDPNLKPNHSDEVTLTLQRSFSPKLLMEVGYIGRKISNEFQEINIDALPYMTTEGGQTFAQAYANVYSEYCGLQGANSAGVTCNKNAAAVTNQPFFETALGGANSAYCAALNSCTKTVIANEGSNIATTNVYSLWTDIGKSPSWILGRTLLNQVQGTGLNAQLAGSFDFINSYGHGSYNALFATFKTTNFHGWTTQQNFTWGRALGTGSVVQASSSITVPNPFDFNNFGTYGVQNFDVKYIYSLVAFYQEPWFKNQRGILGRTLGGWVLAPLFTARSGFPQRITCDASSTCSGMTSDQSESYSEAAGAAPFTGGYAGEGYYNYQNANGSIGSAGNPAAKTPGSGINLFNNPVQVASEFRPFVLGLDTNSGGAGVIRGFPFWNLDATLSKDFRIVERVSATLIITSVNTLNHFVPNNPTTSIQSLATWGVVTSQFTTGNGVQSRWMEFGLRLHF